MVEATSKFVVFRGLNCSSPPESAFFLPFWESLVNPQSASCIESYLVKIVKIESVALT